MSKLSEAHMQLLVEVTTERHKAEQAYFASRPRLVDTLCSKCIHAAMIAIALKRTRCVQCKADNKKYAPIWDEKALRFEYPILKTKGKYDEWLLKRICPECGCTSCKLQLTNRRQFCKGCIQWAAGQGNSEPCQTCYAIKSAHDAKVEVAGKQQIAAFQKWAQVKTRVQEETGMSSSELDTVEDKMRCVLGDSYVAVQE